MLLCLWVLLFGLGACRHGGEQSYQQTVESAEDHEKNNPQEFLKLTADSRKNMGGKWVMNGVVANTARLTDFHAVVIHIVFLDKNKSKISELDATENMTVPKGGQAEFKEKLDAPDGTASISYALKGASAN